MSQDQNRNPLPSLAEDEQFISADAFSSANSAFDWDTLVSRGGCSNNANNQNSGMSRWERDSLYVKFDPLLNSKKGDGRGGDGDDRLSSVFKVPKLPGGFAPPPSAAGGGGDVFGGGNANLISPLSDSGSYKSASQDLSPSDLLDGEFAAPQTNGNGSLDAPQSPPSSPQDQLAMGDAGLSLYAATVELEADLLKENLNETVDLVSPTLLEDGDKTNGNGGKTPPILPMTPPPTFHEATNGEDGVSPQNNLLFSPFTVTPVKRADPDELFGEFKKTVVIQSPARCGAVFGVGSGDPDPESIDEEEFKYRAEQSISDDSFLEAFSRGVYIKTPARPVGIVQPHEKSPDGDNNHQDFNGTFDLTPVSASESLNVTQILAHPDQDESNAETIEKDEEQELEELNHSQIPPPPPIDDDYYEEDGEELEERLDRTATPVIDVSFSEEDLIPTAPNSVEPSTPEAESEKEQGCQDSAGVEVLSASSPKMNESFENQRRLSAFFANTTPKGCSPSPNASFSPNKIVGSPGEPVENSETESSPIPPSPSPPRPPPASQEQLQRIQKLKETLAQLETEYEEQCMEADQEIAMKEAKLKAISDQVDLEATSLENLEAALELAKQERNQALDDLKQMEANFAEMLNMYENIKSLQTRVEQNCQILQKREFILAQALERKEDRDNAACQVVADCLEVMKHDFETRVKEREAENIKLKARLRMSEMSVEKMEAKMGQLDRESEKLRGLCDELLNSQGLQ